MQKRIPDLRLGNPRAIWLSALLHLGIVGFLFLAALSCTEYQWFFNLLHLPSPVVCGAAQQQGTTVNIDLRGMGTLTQPTPSTAAATTAPPAPTQESRPPPPQATKQPVEKTKPVPRKQPAASRSSNVGSEKSANTNHKSVASASSEKTTKTNEKPTASAASEKTVSTSRPPPPASTEKPVSSSNKPTASAAKAGQGEGAAASLGKPGQPKAGVSNGSNGIGVALNSPQQQLNYQRYFNENEKFMRENPGYYERMRKLNLSPYITSIQDALRKYWKPPTDFGGKTCYTTILIPPDGRLPIVAFQSDAGPCPLSDSDRAALNQALKHISPKLIKAGALPAIDVVITARQ